MTPNQGAKRASAEQRILIGCGMEIRLAGVAPDPSGPTVNWPWIGPFRRLRRITFPVR
jgi:hypothetical protein